MQFNDYLFRLKVFGELSRPLRAETTDKLSVKDYIRRTVGGEFVVPTLGILTTFQELDSHAFRAGTVVKPSHMSGQVLILRNPDEVAALDKTRLRQWLSEDYYLRSRERNYKGLQPKILIEEIIFGPRILDDYKIFCFKGVAKFIQVDSERHSKHCRQFFDSQGKPLDFSLIYPQNPNPKALPDNFGKMLSVASELSRDFEFVRVDMYSNGSDIKVGELTHCPEGASGNFIPWSAESLASTLLFQN